MEDADIWAAFQFLFDDLSKDPRNDVYAKKPLLAHYTSLDNLERILESKEIWLSNPVFMNDHEELRFGLLNGIAAFKRNAAVWTALGDEERRRKFFEALDRQLVDFELNHLINTYVFCLSEHEREDKDGLLSMWRGYGWNGKGAALVFDVGKIEPIGPISDVSVHSVPRAACFEASRSFRAACSRGGAPHKHVE